MAGRSFALKFLSSDPTIVVPFAKWIIPSIDISMESCAAEDELSISGMLSFEASFVQETKKIMNNVKKNDFFILLS